MIMYTAGELLALQPTVCH